MKKVLLIPAVIILFYGCSNGDALHSNDGEIVSSAAAEGESEEDLKNVLTEIEQEEAATKGSITTVSFDKSIHNFGKIKEDTDNPVSFTVTNTGNKPLIIEKVDVSCGCTTAKKPEKPIAPGKSDKIEVVFHPKVGQLNEQKKTVTITANTEPVTSVLTIEAFVIK